MKQLRSCHSTCIAKEFSSEFMLALKNHHQ